MMKKHEEQTRYLSQAIQLEESVNPAIIRNTLMMIGVTVVTFTLWAGFTNIYEVARTPGEVVPNGYERVVQHLEGGIIKTIDVKEGDMVTAGQPLLTLDGAGSFEDLQRARIRHVTLALQEERLRAYADGRMPDFSQFQKDHPDLVADQEKFFASTAAARGQERQIVREQIVQKERMIESLKSELATAKENLAITRDLFERRAALHSQGYLSDTRFLETQQGLNNIKGDIAAIRNRITLANAEMAEYRSRLSSLDSSQSSQSNDRLDAVLAEKSQNEELLQKLEARVSRLEVRAPESGIVKGLAVNTVGGVVRPGETLMEIVPIGDDLMVEVKIRPQDIGHVKPGQPVKVKFSNYDFSRYGLVDGKIQQISATTFGAEDGGRYYQGRIRLDRPYVGRDPANTVSPGMTVMAEIITGRKTILQYLLKPIHNSLKTAFSER